MWDEGLAVPASSFLFLRKAKTFSEAPTDFPLCLIGQNEVLWSSLGQSLTTGHLESYWNTMRQIRTHLLGLESWPMLPEMMKFPPTTKSGFWQEKSRELLSR